MSADAITSFFAIALGFAVAAMLTHGYQAALKRQPSFRLLQAGPVPAAFAAVPFLMFAAPFIIMRTTVRHGTAPSCRVQSVAAATVFAGFWSMMSGTWVIMGLQAAGLLG
jgi:hypothetical protein